MPIERKKLNSSGPIAGIGHADAAHAEHVAQRSVNQDVAEPVPQAIAGAHRLAVENGPAAALGDAHEVMEELLLDLSGILHADHHRSQQAFEDPRRREIINRADLAQVGHDRLGRLGTVDGESGHQRLGMGKQMIADPGHRQVGEDVAVAAHAVDLHAALGGGDERGVRLADAFRLSGRPGRVEHDRNVIVMTLADFIVEDVGMVAVMDPPHLDQFLDVVQERLRVVPHPARIVIDDVFQRADLRHDLEQLVDLLLVLDDREADAGILHHEQHLVGHRVLVERNRHPAQGLGGAHHHVKVRPIVADDGQVVAAPETEFREAAGERPHAVGDFGPGQGLPDSQVLLAHRRSVRTIPRVIEQQAREGMEATQRPGTCLHGHSCLLSAAPRRDTV